MDAEEDSCKIIEIKNVLSETELQILPQEIKEKVNNYILEKLDDFFVVKALYETSKANLGNQITQFEANVYELCTKNSDTENKLKASNDTLIELEKELEHYKNNLQKNEEKLCYLESEGNSLKSAYNNVVDERDELMRVLQQKTAMIDIFEKNEAYLSEQLQAAIEAKSAALALNNDLQSKELSLQYGEKRIDQERSLFNSQLTALTDEVNRLNSELQTVQLNNSSRSRSLEKNLVDKTKDLNAANETITHLQEVKTNLDTKIDSLTQLLHKQRESENKRIEGFKKELDVKTRLADLYKSEHDDAEEKTKELSEGIVECQKIIHDAVEKYGNLETKYEQAKSDHEVVMENKNEIISSLKKELEHANDLIKVTNAQNVDHVLEDLAPTAVAANKLLKSGITLTQLYSQLVEVSDNLAQEKDENRQLNLTINSIIKELEERSPLLQQQREEYEEAITSKMAVLDRLDSLSSECNSLKDSYAESSRIANHYSRENNRLKEEIADLGRQVCCLLKEVDESRSGFLTNGNNDNAKSLDASENNSSHNLSKTKITFTDIQELQSNNQKLLRMVRDLTAKQDELERHREQSESKVVQNKIESLNTRVTELTEAQERQTKMINGLIRQRDMFKRLYHEHVKEKQLEMSSTIDNTEMDTDEITDRDSINDKKIPGPITVADLELKLKQSEIMLHVLQKEHKLYKDENQNREKMLLEQIENMRLETIKLTSANSKSLSTSECNNERIKTLQASISTYKKNIESLEKNNNAADIKIAKQEASLQFLRDEATTAKSKLIAAEVQIQQLELEITFIKNEQLKIENENRERHIDDHGQKLILENVNIIKSMLECHDTDNHNKLKVRFEEVTRECTALRRRLHEEQERFLELSSNLKIQTDAAVSNMQKEKDSADEMRREILQLKQDLLDKSKCNEDLARKLNFNVVSNPVDNSETSKIIRDMKNSILEKEIKIKSLEEQLVMSNEHVTRYCALSECAESKMKNLIDDYEKYKHENSEKVKEYTEKVNYLTEHCAELEAELSLYSSGETTTSTNIKNELNTTKDQLNEALESVHNYCQELNAAKLELSKLSDFVRVAEEQYVHEKDLHSSDLEKLVQIKNEFTLLQNKLHDTVMLKDNIIAKLESENVIIVAREDSLKVDNEKYASRIEYLNLQNSLLLDQLQTLSTQLTVSHASQSFSDSMNEHSNELNVNSSFSEVNSKSSDEMLQIIKYLRKEKDIAVSKCDILQAETLRIKSLLEISEKKLEDTKLLLAAEIEKSQRSMITITNQENIFKKFETINALTDSNRILQEERDNLEAHVEKLTNSIESLEGQMAPMKENILELSNKNDVLQSENTSLKAASARWRKRVNSLVERANKTSPEDWKRLQNERESLARLLAVEKDSVKKLNEELSTIKTEKLKLVEQQSLLSRQYLGLTEDHKKSNELIQTLKDDLLRLNNELTKVKAELNSLSILNKKHALDLKNKEESLLDIRNKEIQIRKIAKKYKSQYEELAKIIEDDKVKKQDEATAAAAISKRNEELIAELQTIVDIEKANNEKLKSELESLRTSNLDKDEKAKQVLKQAKNKIVQLTESKKQLSNELNESLCKIESLEQSHRNEQEVRSDLIKSQYEGAMTRLEKEKGEAQAEVEALQQKINILQRHIANQASVSKQQAGADKPNTDPPTANIKPMSGVTQQSMSGNRRGGETPLASIRPMAQVGPTAPHDAHSTEYMPASSSRPRATVAASTVPPESTQGVALVMPQIEQPSGIASSGNNTVASPSSSVAGIATMGVSSCAANMSHSNHSVSPSNTSSLPEGSAAQSSSGGVSTSLAPPEMRPMKRPRPPQHSSSITKSTKLQKLEQSHDVEYQVPTSSRCDQDDEGVIVVDSEIDDEGCTGTTYREVEEEQDDEDIEDDQEVVQGGNNDEIERGEEDPTQERPDSPVQSAEVGPEGSHVQVEAAEADSERVAAHAQIEAITSGTEQSGTLSLGGSGDDGDDSIVPSTPTLYVPRRNDGFGEAVVSPLSVAGSSLSGVSAARFTFLEAGVASHHDTHADLAGALPPPALSHRRDSVENLADDGDDAGGDWQDGGEDDIPAVSSQGSHPCSPQQQVAEEGREAEASATPALSPRRTYRSDPTQSPQHRWPTAEGDASSRGRGLRPRGRATRRIHGYPHY